MQKLAEGMGLPLSAIQETQELIHRMRSQMSRLGSPAGESAPFHLGHGAAGPLDGAALRTEMDQVAGDAGRLVNRLVRLVLQLLATEALEPASNEGGELPLED